MTEFEFKSKAEEFFKSSKYEEAIEFYEKALHLIGSNAIVHNSNLSACFYELGTVYI